MRLTERYPELEGGMFAVGGMRLRNEALEKGGSSR